VSRRPKKDIEKELDEDIKRVSSQIVPPADVLARYDHLKYVTKVQMEAEKEALEIDLEIEMMTQEEYDAGIQCMEYFLAEQEKAQQARAAASSGRRGGGRPAAEVVEDEEGNHWKKQKDFRTRHFVWKCIETHQIIEHHPLTGADIKSPEGSMRRVQSAKRRQIAKRAQMAKEKKQQEDEALAEQKRMEAQRIKQEEDHLRAEEYERTMAYAAAKQAEEENRYNPEQIGVRDNLLACGGASWDIHEVTEVCESVNWDFERGLDEMLRRTNHAH